MVRSKSLYLKSFTGLENWSNQAIQSRFNIGFDDSRGFGFMQFNPSDERIDAILVYQTVILQQVFDIQAQIFTPQEQVLFHQISFELDLKNQLLIGEAGGSKFQKLLSVISQVFERQVEIGDIYIKMSDFLREFGRATTFQIAGIVVENFQPQKGLSGQFIAKVDDQAVAHEVIENYQHNVSSLVITLRDFEDEIIWKISSLGKLTVRADESDLDQQLQAIKKIVMRCNYA